MRDRAGIHLAPQTPLHWPECRHFCAEHAPKEDFPARPICWLPRLHLIRRAVTNSVRSHYDRHDLEQLFELQPGPPRS